MKQTAVEWLIEQMKTKQFIYLDRTEILNQAKELEKQQSYSEEEVYDLLLNCPTNTEKDTIEWFEQFKKK